MQDFGSGKAAANMNDINSARPSQNTINREDAGLFNEEQRVELLLIITCDSRQLPSPRLTSVRPI